MYCDKEPIHMPGAIQPFGALIALSPDEVSISHASGNLNGVLRLTEGELPEALRLESLFEAGSIKDLAASIKLLGGNDGSAPRVHMRDLKHSSNFHVFPYKSSGKILLEVERFQPQAEEQFVIDDHFVGMIVLLQNCNSVSDLCSVAARELRKLTGFERVMMYRFHDDEHGEVIAEDVAPGLDPYLGLHYPATDIPAPARRVFLLNSVRMIPDVDYEPVSIRPIAGLRSEESLDLSRSTLRAVSPIHIEFMKNIGQKSTLTLSIVHRGKLWGLITCAHHSSPKFVSVGVRSGCEIAAKLISTLITSIEELRLIQQRRETKGVRERLIRQIEPPLDLNGLMTERSNLLDLIPAQGVAASFDGGASWSVLGQTPTIDQISRLADWIRQQDAGPVFCSNSLSRCFPDASEYAGVASGLLSMTIPDAKRILVFWFRPEVIQTVTWGGNPNESGEVEAMRLHPRKSFAAWKVTVKAKSLPWQPWENEAAADLRNDLLAVDLKKQIELEQQARRKAVLADRVKEDLMAVVSHDLRNPLNSILLNLRLLRQLSNTETLSKTGAVIGSMERSVETMRRLIEDLLDVARIEGGRVELDRRAHSVESLIQEVVDMLHPIAREKDIQLRCSLENSSACVWCDRERIIQVLSNVIGNALKFSPPSTAVCIETRGKGSEIQFSVADAGAGIDEANLPFIFDRFWQAHEKGVSGTGLGLAISKGFVEAHGGRITASSQKGKGSTFSFSLPIFQSDQSDRN
jgi:light-regulated signal transduction histidine kinase (bacteriophytochrome)